MKEHKHVRNTSMTSRTPIFVSKQNIWVIEEIKIKLEIILLDNSEYTIFNILGGSHLVIHVLLL